MEHSAPGLYSYAPFGGFVIVRCGPRVRYAHPGLLSFAPSRSDFSGAVDLTRKRERLPEAEVQLEAVQPRDMRVNVFGG